VVPAGVEVGRAEVASEAVAEAESETVAEAEVAWGTVAEAEAESAPGAAVAEAAEATEGMPSRRA
jgi:hypothetical protein